MDRDFLCQKCYATSTMWLHAKQTEWVMYSQTLYISSQLRSSTSPFQMDNQECPLFRCPQMLHFYETLPGLIIFVLICITS
ncbi:hypothetical protein Pelo_8084 [Pelomyxa schiedti]|nr:hypothetical protein Pelo_8084 [Pelomyxa schiedti]